MEPISPEPQGLVTMWRRANRAWLGASRAKNRAAALPDLTNALNSVASTNLRELDQARLQKGISFIPCYFEPRSSTAELQEAGLEVLLTLLRAAIDVSSVSNILSDVMSLFIRASTDAKVLSGRGLDVAAQIALILLAEPDIVSLELSLQRNVLQALIVTCASRVNLRHAQYRHRTRGRIDSISDSERALGPSNDVKRFYFTWTDNRVDEFTVENWETKKHLLGVSSPHNYHRFAGSKAIRAALTALDSSRLLDQFVQHLLRVMLSANLNDDDIDTIFYKLGTLTATSPGAADMHSDLTQQLAAKQEELRGAHAQIQRLNNDIDKLHAEVAERDVTIQQQVENLDAKISSMNDLKTRHQQHMLLLEEKDSAIQELTIGHHKQAKELGQKDAALTAARTTMQQQDETLKEKDTLIQQLQTRIDEVEQELRLKDERPFEQRAEATLNVNIPQSRFSDIEKARNHNKKVIKGSYGTLYTATLGGHRVALKRVDVDTRPRLAEILRAPEATSDEEDKRLLREAHVLLSTRHPNIVSFLGLSHDEDSNTLSFVMSWAEGGTLYDHLHVHERGLTPAQRARIAMELAGAMQFLHAHGIVHRDLKSPNVLLDDSLSAKVTDFGLSAFKKGDTDTLTNQMGTLLWASPEQLLRLKLYADTDVFSFAVLCWELYFDCKPWHHGEYAGDGAGIVVMSSMYSAGKYLPVDEEINGVVLSAAQQQLLDGCFDVSGRRLAFTQLHTALRDLYKQAKQDEQLDEEQKREQAKLQEKQLLGSDTAVWKFPLSLLETVKAVTKQLPSRPSVSIAPLDLHRDVDAVNKLLAEAGGLTAAQPNPLKPFNNTLAAVAITHDKQKAAAFNGALARNRTRYRGHLTSGSSHPFSPKYEHNTGTKEPTDEEQKQVLERVTCGTAYSLLEPSLLQEDPPLRLQRVFHGVTSWGAVVGILGGGFAPLRRIDHGFYGTGIYFTPDLDYALRYSYAFWKQSSATATVPPELQHLELDPGKEYRLVLACDIQYGNPYPVLDAATLVGKPLKPAHDAQVAVVREPTLANLSDAVPFASHTEWTKEGGRRPLAELVVDDTSCILVRAVLVFEA